MHYNGPPLPKADGIIKAALDIHFGGKPWHFTQTSREGQRSAFSLEGLVMRRHSVGNTVQASIHGVIGAANVVVP